MRQLAVARHAARTASEVINRYFREGVEMREKGPGDLVSAADVDAEKAIASVIHQAFPNDAILGEESHSAPADSERLWIVDPIDGTTNFAHQIPHFAVSIAYYERGVPMCGLIHNPVTGDWYSAIKGEGALVNGKKARVNPHATLNETIVAMGFFPGMTPETKATFDAAQEFVRAGVHGVRRLGAASLDFCNVGCGFYGAYFEYALAPWDFAAGRLFVEEAGGKVTTASGDPLPTGRSSILATNGILHDAALEIVRAQLR
ncbi:Inositol-1-monophosphatase [Caulifigura coniformis]|uniref:Inositol-1-monophosphatase n=1 Tax=Caulifigura coniformis TaxID=2527983 RepID=A0A517S856_9PLAN|nr:inositol monophosphatase family protein [Caulifigura coniformis]QDT52315.1 Inositol-1-monophosphatase [Caulifigura coniformis]